MQEGNPLRFYITASPYSTRYIFVEKPVSLFHSSNLCELSIQGRPVQIGPSFLIWEFHYWKVEEVKTIVRDLLHENFVPYMKFTTYPGAKGLPFYDNRNEG